MGKKLRNDSPDGSVGLGRDFTFVQSKFTEETIARLISRVEKRTGRKIEDHDHFGQTCGALTWFYLQTKAMDRSPTPKQALKAWERMNRHFDAFRAEFNDLVDRCGFYLPLRHVEEYYDKSGNSYSADKLIDRTQKSFDQIERTLLANLRGVARHADLYREGGRRKPEAFDDLIHFGGKLYFESVKLAPGTHREAEDGGRFVVFIRDLLEIVDPEKAKAPGLAQSVHASLKRVRAEHPCWPEKVADNQGDQ